MNCTQLTTAIDDVGHFVLSHDAGFATGATLLVLVSVVFLAYGEVVIKPMGAVVGGVGGAVGVYVALSEVDCVARLAVAGITGVVLAVLALCVLHTGLVLVGAAGLAAVAHFVHDAVPPLRNVQGAPFTLMGRSAYYYMMIAAALLVGGALACFRRKAFVRVSTALVGGAGLAVATHLVVSRTTRDDAPALVVLAVLVVAACTGAFVQTWLARRRKARRQMAT